MQRSKRSALNTTVRRHDNHIGADTVAVTQYASTLPFDVTPEPRVLYDNAFVGLSKSAQPAVGGRCQAHVRLGLLFGLVSLEAYAASHESPVPRVIAQAISEIDARGLDAEGIYVRS